MAADHTIETLAQGPLTHIVVEWDPRPLSLSAPAQARIDACWAACLEDARRAGRTLFDGAITRLIGYHVEGPVLHLELGPADFKTFMVTSLRDHAWFAAHAPEAICAGLGNSGLLWQGDRCLLGIRSSNVAAYAGRAHVFGGVCDGLGTADFAANAAGLIQHLRRELLEEVGITRHDLAAAPQLLGLVWDPVLQQPELLWSWELRTPMDNLVHRIHEDEHSAYLILDRSAPGMVLDNLTPAARWAVGVWAPKT